uniref:Telomere repeat-binding factor dimerisation domain-containing protein n=1 Tax=Cyprinus carpio TaxID=7962 RepID=A0A8C1YLB1_CYPCA
MIVKLRCMQFLSRINNGDKLDLTFEEPKTPLESAVSVLESICRDMSVPPREQERVKQAIIETLIMVCLRSGEFTRAEEVLLRHFSDAADSAGKKKLFESLIRRRRSSHSVLQLSSYADFKQDMLDFIERLYRVPEPFLLQMLKRSGHPGISSEPVTSSSQDRQKTSAAAEHHGGKCALVCVLLFLVCVSGVCARLSLHSLRQVYGVLSERYGVSVSFTQLQQELEEEQEQEESPELHLALSETPREQPEPPYAGMTISRLVQEDDSQLSTAEEEETQITAQTRTILRSGRLSDARTHTTTAGSAAGLMSDRVIMLCNIQCLTAVCVCVCFSECSPAQICTPARHTQKHNRCVDIRHLHHAEFRRTGGISSSLWIPKATESRNRFCLRLIHSADRSVSPAGSSCPVMWRLRITPRLLRPADAHPDTNSSRRAITGDSHELKASRSVLVRFMTLVCFVP